MFNQRTLAYACGLSLLLSGCGGSKHNDASGSTDTAHPDAQISAPEKMGRIAGIEGLAYESDDLTGTTDELGKFKYRPDKPVRFSVGGITVGSTLGQQRIELSDLVPENSSQPQTTALNIARFLQTLDLDGSPTNGVFIDASIHEAAKNVTLEFDIPEAQFVQQSEMVLQAELATATKGAVLQHSLSQIVVQETERSARAMARPFTFPSVAVSAERQEEATRVIDLMLRNTLTEGQSDLEFIFRTFNVPFDKESNHAGLVALYDHYMTHLQEIGANAPVVMREALVAKPLAATFTPIHYFSVMSDFQVNDDESPFSLSPFKRLVGSAYYPASAHVLNQVDDMVNTLRKYTVAQGKNLDMAIFTGDLTDISQYNEARWGIDVLDGGPINPDSGVDDDPIPGQNEFQRPNDTFDPFVAVGLAGNGDQQEIPWYFVAGNHDGLVWGNFPITDKDLNLFGKRIRGGTRTFYNNIALGSLNYLGNDPTYGGFLQHLFNPDELFVIPDPNRRVVAKDEIALEMFNTTGTPVGHGMQHVENIKKDLHYSFTSAGGLVRHIVMDTNAPAYAAGFLPLSEINWLERELALAQQNGELVIVSSHHRPSDILINGKLFVDTMNKYPNVIANLVAHNHQNRIIPRPGPTPENGYWEIESGSMVNWPQQFRLLEISVDLETGVGKIDSTMLNHESEAPISVSNRGRFLAYLETVVGHFPNGDGALMSEEGKPEDRNAALFFKIPENVLNRLRNTIL